MRLFFLSCRPFRLMSAQRRLVTSVRGTALSPITSLSAGLGCTGFMNAALGFLPDFFLAMPSPLTKRCSVVPGVPRNPPTGPYWTSALNGILPLNKGATILRPPPQCVYPRLATRDYRPRLQDSRAIVLQLKF